MKKRVLSMLLVAAMLPAVLAGCGSKEDPAASGASGSVAASAEKRDDINIYSEGVFTSMDPHGPGAFTYTNLYVMNQIYEPLVMVENDGSITPVLATEWSISEDGKVYSFTLREGVKFHNGEELKGSDVAYSYERAMSLPGLETYYRPIESVVATGDYTVDVNLKEPFAPMLSYLYYIPIVSEKFASENELNIKACGTGPYMLESIDLNLEATVTAFPDYWKGEASIKTANFKVITEATTASVSFESGDLDLFFCYNTSAYAPLAETGKYNTELVAQRHTAVILLNNQVAPLDNKLVRQALSHATDRETMIAIAYDGLAAPTYLSANPTCFGVSEDQFYNHYEYDLEKAKALLAEAGYPNGLDLGEMTIIGGSYHEKYAQVWQQSLAQIGVTVELVASESADADTSAGDYVTATMGESFTSDFAIATKFYSGNASTKTQYNNPVVTELFEKAAVEMDSEKRLEYSRELIDIVFEECPNIPIFNKQVPWVWDKDLSVSLRSEASRPYYVYEMKWN